MKQEYKKQLAEISEKIQGLSRELCKEERSEKHESQIISQLQGYNRGLREQFEEKCDLLDELQSEIECLKSGVQKMSAQIEMLFAQASSRSAEVRFHDSRINKLEGEYEERMRRIEDKIYE